MMLHTLISLMGGQDGGIPADGTWNPADKTSAVVLSNSNTTADLNTAGHESVRSTFNTFNTTAGRKLYWESVVDAIVSSTDAFTGLYQTGIGMASNNSIILVGTNYAIWRDSNAKYVAGGWVSNTAASAYVTGDIQMWALDEATGKLWTGKNGTWNGSGDPAAGTNETFNSMPSAVDMAFVVGTDNSAGSVQITLVATAGALTYSAPSGFTAGLV
jgi:hypothetical protein